MPEKSIVLNMLLTELTGQQEKLEAFMDLLAGYEILELARGRLTQLRQR